MDGEIFMTPARKCRRCGRLLFSKEALERGYGCLCEQKAKRDGTYGKEQPEGQMTIADYFKTESEENE